MKKIVTIVAMVLMAVMSMNAQEESNAMVSLLKVNFEGVTPSYTPTGDNIMKVEPTEEGLALINPIKWDTRWWKSMMVLTDDCLTLQKKHKYIVRLTMNVPHKRENARFDRISYTVRLGNWDKWYQNVVTIDGGDDFQVVDFEFPKFPYDIDGDGHIVIMHQFVTGITTILKELEVFEEIIPESPSPVVDGMKLISKKNWEGVDGIICWDGDHDWDVEGTDEGVAIINPTLKGESWAAQLIVVNEFDLEQHHDYIVRLTMKVPSDGTYTMNIGSWTDNYLCQIPVTASGDFQIVDVMFPDFTGDSEMVNSLEGCHVMLQCGWVVGTTVLKKVEVYEKIGSDARGNTTGLKVVKATNADGAIYNLAGQKVDASYKGIVTQNGKKRIMK